MGSPSFQEIFKPVTCPQMNEVITIYKNKGAICFGKLYVNFLGSQRR